MQTTLTAESYWVTGASRGEIRTEALPACQTGEIIVRTLYSGISRGTETLVFRGDVPASEHVRMRAPFQVGDFPAPVKYGYCTVGEIIDGPARDLGRIVFCLHPHQTRFVVPADAVCSVPAETPPARAVLAANMETAVNGLWDAGLGAGDRVSVLGAGSVGCLVAWLAARHPGVEVELIDTNEARGEIAAALGVGFSLPGQASAERDLVVHASGQPEGLQTALELAGQEATVLELSWFGARQANLALGGAFHSRRLRIQGSQVGSLPAARLARWTYQRRLQLALRLLAAPELDALITDDTPFAQLPELMARLAVQPGGPVFHRITY